MAKPKPRLGRGLNGILSGGKETSSSGSAPKKKATPAATSAPPKRPLPPARGYQEIQVSLVKRSPYQPRKDIPTEKLQDLANSIRAEGLLQPIVVRPAGKEFELIAGERRLRAFELLNLKQIPARIMEIGDASSASLALIENLQREQLNPVEEALGYASLMKDFDLTQEETAERVGKGRATIANSLRLLHLNSEIQGFLGRGLLTTGHAKVLLGIEDPTLRGLLARRIIEEGMSVRETENQVKRLNARGSNQSTKKAADPGAENSALDSLRKDLEKHLRAPVQVKQTGKKGRIVIQFTGNDDLDRILQQLGMR
ncbi:ParB/RepB/Spo0J family partition protein [Puniceicoccus vermicola]|uniref:ParB/RepB/Spo0J family partition protein n=1 Tax=Puniceicoccus vermicola TaxID=388746 RepID=A0A7X1B377_9BACT|nr:ParB/RepB/Spo0J family partition protein [Puniceicoccus vermicola]MBC2603703.1 ParB/RepB/Spo0J family partition protein [Puniceicoccus vermicola]